MMRKSEFITIENVASFPLGNNGFVAIGTGMEPLRKLILFFFLETRTI